MREVQDYSSHGQRSNAYGAGFGIFVHGSSTFYTIIKEDNKVHYFCTIIALK
jgi:hypothetical protein